MERSSVSRERMKNGVKGCQSTTRETTKVVLEDEWGEKEEGRYGGSVGSKRKEGVWIRCSQ